MQPLCFLSILPPPCVWPDVADCIQLFAGVTSALTRILSLGIFSRSKKILPSQEILRDLSESSVCVSFLCVRRHYKVLTCVVIQLVCCNMRKNVPASSQFQDTTHASGVRQRHSKTSVAIWLRDPGSTISRHLCHRGCGLGWFVPFSTWEAAFADAGLSATAFCLRKTQRGPCRAHAAMKSSRRLQNMCPQCAGFLGHML